MKKIYLFIIIGLTLISCKDKTTRQGYHIKGNIRSSEDVMVFLQKNQDKETITVDSVIAENGEFSFKGKVEFPSVYFLKFGEKEEKIKFFLENSKIQINAHIDSLDQGKIIGSATENMYRAFLNDIEKYDQKLTQLYNEYKKATKEENKALIASIDSSYTRIMQNKMIAIRSFVAEHPNTVLAPYIIRKYMVPRLDLEELERWVDTLDISLRNSKYVDLLYHRIKKLRSVLPGQSAPDFTLPDTSGTPVSLSSVMNGNYLLIDFWASWCTPCRKENPHVVHLYRKYHRKGFDILGVSLDKDKEKWIKAIKNDKLTWHHVSDLKGWKNKVSNRYGVMSIPHTVLIDPEGKIVVHKLRGDKLEKKLEEIYGY